MSDADLEYGPTPKGAQYEHTDIAPALVGQFALWLAVAMVISVGIVYGTFWLFESREAAASEAAQVFPLAQGQRREPDAPRLQTQPFRDIYELKNAERERLNSYGWIDQSAGVVHIPIEEALRILAERGGVPASAQAPAGMGEVVQDSSAGRTRAPR